MYSYLISMLALVLGYIFYGKFVQKIFGPDSERLTPAVAINDGVDYVPMPVWKVFMVQFLNIAGTGPIFGAIMGAKFGPSCYLWVVFGCIFAGAVHDYLSGMVSIRNGGIDLPTIVGRYLGKTTRAVMLTFCVVLLVLVGAVFVYSPASILGDLLGDGSFNAVMIWVGVIIVYYVLATLVPIDKIIGKIYPLFAFALIFMAIAMMVGLFVKWPVIPEFWQGLGNRGPSVGLNGQSIFPCLCITVACGAISGFHATQSTLMARCLTNEKLGRPVFYGTVIVEGMVALTWAAVASYFFFDGGAEEVGSTMSAAAPKVVSDVSRAWLGVAGSVLALLGVVAAPITSGDTALRSARLIIADVFKYDQKPISNRLRIVIPLFAVTALILWFNIANEDGFNIIWRYFALANQALSCFTLWALTSFLVKERGKFAYLITFIPAVFMTTVCITYISTAKIGFNLPMGWSGWIAAIVSCASIALFYSWYCFGRKK
ncbi:MAG: carbon starvation protein A [Bacteroidales bacterium]|nr:carbon starvation protein A [Candidatus Cryptobacteroides caccocaballi]